MILLFNITRNKLYLIKQAIRGKGKCHQNYCWTLYPFSRYEFSYRELALTWYTFKTCICILLNLRRVHNHKDEIVDSISLFDIYSTYTDYGPGMEFTDLSVGYGVIKGWFYTTYRDGYP